MLYFVARRLVSALSVVLVTLIATFALFFIAPTDPAGAICGERNCTQQRYNEIKENLHLDQPKVQQFAEYTAGIFVGRTSPPPASCSIATLRASGFSLRTTGR